MKKERAGNVISNNLVAILLSLTCGIVLLLFALSGSGVDWYISETLSEIIYSAIFYYQEIPYFTFFLNGGSYMIQDPQSPLLSISTLWILLFGPHGGIRFAAFFWGIAGCYSMYAWLRHKIGNNPALFAGVSWVLSNGFFWRLTVGHDMFLWYLGVPILLIVLEKLIKQPSFRNSVLAGLIFGLYLAGPTFHALVYFVAPLILLWFIIFLIANKNKSSIKKLLLYSLSAIGIAIMITAPKLISWFIFPMKRPIIEEGTLFLKDTIISLIYFIPNWTSFSLNNVLLDSGSPIFLIPLPEVNIALTPFATALALFGVLVPFRKKIPRPATYIYAVILVILGIFLASSSHFATFFHQISNGSFRVVGRFTAISAFGLAILSGYGLQLFLSLLKKKYHKIIISTVFLSILIFSGYWFYSATNLITDDFTPPAPLLQPLSPLWTHQKINETNPVIVRMDISTETAEANKIINNKVTMSEWKITGNDDNALLNNKINALLSNKSFEAPLSDQLSPDQIQLTHTTLTILDLPANTPTTVRLSSAIYQKKVTTQPKNADVEISDNNGQLVITNHSDNVIEKVTIKVTDPIPVIAWIISALTLLAATIFLLLKPTLLRLRKR
ncbi:MAG: hypothetical protein Q8P90_00205 [bacterium]|nr:hypothetical protein [bacterium]